MKIAIVLGLIALISGGTYFAYQVEQQMDKEAKVKEFITHYVSLTQDEQISDYFKVTKSEKYDNARLAMNLWKAIPLSKGLESKINMNRYAKSTDRFIVLKREEYQIKFIVKDVTVQPYEGNKLLAIVKGEYEGKHIRSGLDVKLAEEFIGKKELRYVVEPATANEAELNTYKLLVSWSETKNL